MLRACASKCLSTQNQKSQFTNLSRMPPIQGNSDALYPALWNTQGCKTKHVQCRWQRCKETGQVTDNAGSATTPVSIHKRHWEVEAITRKKYGGMMGNNTHTYIHFMWDLCFKWCYASHVAVEWHKNILIQLTGCSYSTFVSWYPPYGLPQRIINLIPKKKNPIWQHNLTG